MPLVRNDRFGAPPRPPRRGLTLVEMLVVVGLVVFLMAIVATIFQAATRALNAAQAFAQIDESLKRIELDLRTDLEGVTARMTPPLDPQDNLGYFEYGENQPADAQGEDVDDYLAFTTRAPEERPFIGRMRVADPTAPGGFRDITITSQVAEVIYFVRNGNLYRRVLLVVPDRAGAVVGSQFIGPGESWLGVNDISARPNEDPLNLAGFVPPPVPNTLGDLTNRHNRFARPRHSDIPVRGAGGSLNRDLANINAFFDSNELLTQGGSNVRFGDGLPDYQPILYPEIFNKQPGSRDRLTTLDSINGYPPTALRNTQVMAFPFVYPYAYSNANVSSVVLGGINNGAIRQPFLNQNADPSTQNQNPLPRGGGDSLPQPGDNFVQTYWGFPTMQETSHPNWIDPLFVPWNTPGNIVQALGIQPPDPNDPNLIDPTVNLLPPQLDQPYSDGFGSNSFLFAADALTDLPVTANGSLPVAGDLLATNVRSFDVKAYDPNTKALSSRLNSLTGGPFAPAFSVAPDYYDLGYAADSIDAALLSLGLTVDPVGLEALSFAAQEQAYLLSDVITSTFAHEGRMPPLIRDFRVDAQFPTFGRYRYPSPSTFNQFFPANNIGDDSPNVIRLRRVFDTWSTDYSDPQAIPQTSFVFRPPFVPPRYPSYPAPYPEPLRGIQIQVRLSDPREERIKSLTIVHDFTDRL